MRGGEPKYPSMFIVQSAGKAKGLSFCVRFKFKLSNYATKETCIFIVGLEQIRPTYFAANWRLQSTNSFLETRS